jgi:hypothetical protein
MPERIEFLAILVFERDDGWVCVEPHRITASHPEIAFQVAMARGSPQRGSRRLVGLAELEVMQTGGPGHAKMLQDSPIDLVKEKADLSAFRDPRWLGVSFDPAELDSALRAPVIEFEPKDLDTVDWGRLSHAYGSAQDVPVYLRSLGAEDPEVRKEARQALYMTILHQGTLYSATVAAMPFLLRLVSIPDYPDRLEVMHFVQNVVKECCLDSHWERHGPLHLTDSTPTRDEGDEPGLVAAVAKVLWADRDLLSSLERDDDPYIRDMAEFVLSELREASESE